ncbi:MAG: TonB-dependent receptor [Calditrichaeota bacterium]|nr:TonB-dependent receptor [Calditrichota bacterium]RQV92906.1 MAG: TonB-dependent receptor [bacterium]RQW02650.1 MAG: TonB-dependent receptor [Calditrichota bacterium]
MQYKKVRIYLVLIFSTLFNYSVPAQSESSGGTIQGKLVDQETLQPLIGANIVLLNTIHGASTDLKGEFIIENVPPDNYTIEFNYLGYRKVTRTDIIVRPGRITYVDEELASLPLASESVIVTAGYFERTAENPLSVSGFSREEIRRAPGSAGDISRIILGLPALAKVDDQSNNLIVRGGSPLENTFYLDNMEIPNINHFPVQGASGGAIGILNVDLIEDVSFYTGGFPAIYGDKLSSVMDISLRDGNHEEHDFQIDLNFAGFGGVAEGPVFKRNGSWLLTIRRSYLDMLVNAVNVGTTMAPSYGDLQSKLVVNLNASHRLSFLGVLADEHNNPDRQTAIENDMIFYGNQDNYQGMGGLNWRALWGNCGYSNTSLSLNSSIYREDFYETGSGDLMSRNRSEEYQLTFRNVTHLKLSKKFSADLGGEFRYLKSYYNNLYAAYFDVFGNMVPPLEVDRQMYASKANAFSNIAFRPIPRININFGMRADYFSYYDNTSFSPRISISYRVSARMAFHASTGIFHQNLPLVFLAGIRTSDKLSDLRAIHYIAGWEYLLTENTRFTAEVYMKKYAHFPLDPFQPGIFLLDELYYRQGFRYNHDVIIDLGRAYARGLELMIQKKLARNLYGLASLSVSKTRYQDLNNSWYDRIYDNRIVFGIEGGYKPSKNWEFSIRWIYAGGRPYTPFDLEQSRNENRAILDTNNINQERYPDYHSLNVRFDRRFQFNRTNLIFYMSIWNAYNRKNISTYYWNQDKNQPDTVYQFGLLPIFGLEYEF